MSMTLMMKPARCCRRQFEPSAQIDCRYNLSAEIDESAYYPGRQGHFCHVQ